VFVVFGWSLLCLVSYFVCDNHNHVLFYGAGKDEQVNFEDEDLDASTTLHLTQLALGSDASPGDHTVYIETNGGFGIAF
jgi:hypothetical protein